MWYDDPLSFIIIIANLIFLYVGVAKRVLLPPIVSMLADLFAYGLGILDSNTIAILVTLNLAPIIMSIMGED